MIIQIDSREKARAIKDIIREFDRQGVKHPVSKLMVGDYMNYDNPRLIIDRKQNLTELCSNVCQDHDRFRRELNLAQEHGIHIVILCEHGSEIETLEDVIFWDNPRRHKRVKTTYGWKSVETMTSDEIKATYTMQDILARYGIRPNHSGYICCPFHSEKTASMKIYKDSYHCFGCGLNGDIFSFIQSMEGISFREAFERLGGTYEHQSAYERKLALYKRRSAESELKKKEQERQKARKAALDDITSARADRDAAEPLSEAWCEAVNRLQIALYRGSEILGYDY